MTSPDETIGPDPLSDPARPTHETAEDLDEDALDEDPLEEGMDTPEQWSPVTRTGHDDLSDRESLDERLAEEEPDLQPEVERELGDQ